MSKHICKPTILFETSWEVCNKVGGIYTVLSTKAKVLSKQFGSKLIFIGPDVWSSENPSPFFKEADDLLKGWNPSLPYGIKIRIGRWDIPGEPIAILVKFDSLYAHKDTFYAEMWEKFGVDSLHAYGDYDEGCAFALAAAMVMESCATYMAKGNDCVIAHFNEWTTGMGLLYLKAHAPYIATVFTTHATSIGRSICGNNKPLYDYFKGYNGDQMAAELNMQSKHSLEKAAAHNADCFTTVSKITADECEQLLEIRPLVTPNGFERAFVPARKDFPAARNNAREALLNTAEKLTGRTFPKNTFLFVTAGRNEFRNKGLDMFIDTVNTLRHNHRGADKRQAIAFILVPSWSDGPRPELQERLEAGVKPATALEHPNLTHVLHDPAGDAIFNKLEWLGMHNEEDDTVCTIYVPCYLNGNDGIFNKSYYELLPGFDAAVFDSYYEPWGYTPHEGIAFGVPTITTNLAGFGQWILSEFDNSFENCGVRVVTRTDSNYADAVNETAQCILELINAKAAVAKAMSNAAVATSKKSEWKQFIGYYDEAYSLAIENNRHK